MEQQILTIVAGLAPDQRIAFAQAQGIPPPVLRQIEEAAVQAGLELVGGSVFEQDAQSRELTEASADTASLRAMLSMSSEKALAYAATLAFFAAIPLVLYIIKERRSMSWRALAEGIARLPFSE